MLDRHHVAAIHRREEADAGIDRLVAQRARLQAAHQNGAGPAIALGAALLGAGEPPVEAQKIQQRARGSNIGQRDLAVVEQEPDLVSLRHSNPSGFHDSPQDNAIDFR